MSCTDCRRAAAYIRVSTDDQVELSPASQLTEIRKYAAANGYTVPDELVFVDEARTGRKVTGREEFRRLIGTAKQKPRPFEAILLWKFSRFARNRDDAVLYKSILRKQLHIDVISIKEPIAEGKLGLLMEALIEAMDEYYSINLAEDVKRGMEEKHRRGELQSAPPFGYAVKDHALTPIAPEDACVREIFRRFCCGEGFLPIARWLNELGMTTHRGGPFESRTVEYILRNPVYTGKLRWNPSGPTRRSFDHPGIVLSDGRHPPLIEPAVWDAAQARLDRRRDCVGLSPPRNGSCRSWLSGLIRCAACGGTLVFVKPHFWKCGRYTRGSCRVSQHVRGELLEEAILTRLRQDTAPAGPLRCTPLSPDGAADKTAQLLRSRRAALERQLTRLRAAYLAGADTVEEYAAGKTALRRQLDALSAQLRAPGQAPCPPDTLAPEALAQAQRTLTYENLPMQQLREAARAVLDHADWDKAQQLLTLHYRLPDGLPFFRSELH